MSSITKKMAAKTANLRVSVEEQLNAQKAGGIPQRVKRFTWPHEDLISGKLVLSDSNPLAEMLQEGARLRKLRRESPVLKD